MRPRRTGAGPEPQCLARIAPVARDRHRMDRVPSRRRPHRPGTLRPTLELAKRRLEGAGRRRRLRLSADRGGPRDRVHREQHRVLARPLHRLDRSGRGTSAHPSTPRFCRAATSGRSPASPARRRRIPRQAGCTSWPSSRRGTTCFSPSTSSTAASSRSRTSTRSVRRLRCSSSAEPSRWTAATSTYRWAGSTATAVRITATWSPCPDCGGAALAYQVPSARGAGIWSAAGVTLDATGNVYFVTGNGASRGTFDFSNAVVELSPGLRVQSYFAPTNWIALNAGDVDLGALGPTLLPDAVLAVGKDGVAYLLQQGRLGGIGGQTSMLHLCAGAFGGTAVSGTTVFVPCTDGLFALSVSPAGLKELWHLAHPGSRLADPGGRGGVGDRAVVRDALRPRPGDRRHPVLDRPRLGPAFQHARRDRGIRRRAGRPRGGRRPDVGLKARPTPGSCGAGWPSRSRRRLLPRPCCSSGPTGPGPAPCPRSSAPRT